MIKVALETTTCKLVTTGRIPPFSTLPEVLLWGTRVFKLVAPPWDPDKPVVYRECFSAYLADTDD